MILEILGTTAQRRRDPDSSLELLAITRNYHKIRLPVTPVKAGSWSGAGAGVQNPAKNLSGFRLSPE